MRGERASANFKAEARCQDLPTIINEDIDSKQQIVNVGKTALFWKKLPSRTFMVREEKVMSGFKGQPDSPVRG